VSIYGLSFGVINSEKFSFLNFCKYERRKTCTRTSKYLVSNALKLEEHYSLIVKDQVLDPRKGVGVIVMLLHITNKAVTELSTLKNE
jgi:hypothetical protein